jgi:hypothetical protein
VTPCSITSRCSSAREKRESGTPRSRGNSHAIALTCATSCGGKTARATRARTILQALEALEPEPSSPLGHDLRRRVQPPGDLHVGQTLRRIEHDPRPLHHPKRRRQPTGEGLKLAREIYKKALADIDALCAPYATVIDIDRSKLPTAEEVEGWTSEQYVGALRHDQSNPLYNSSLRQLLHVGYKVAAKMGDRYLDLLKENEEVVGRNVTENLYDRHIKPLFIGAEASVGIGAD